MESTEAVAVLLPDGRIQTVNDHFSHLISVESRRSNSQNDGETPTTTMDGESDLLGQFWWSIATESEQQDLFALWRQEFEGGIDVMESIFATVELVLTFTVNERIRLVAPDGGRDVNRLLSGRFMITHDRQSIFAAFRNVSSVDHIQVRNRLCTMEAQYGVSTGAFAEWYFKTDTIVFGSNLLKWLGWSQKYEYIGSLSMFAKR